MPHQAPRLSSTAFYRSSLRDDTIKRFTLGSLLVLNQAKPSGFCGVWRMKNSKTFGVFGGLMGVATTSLAPKHGGFRVNAKIRKQIERRKRRIARRLDKNDNRGCDRPIMTASNIHYEIADRTRATAHGGIGAIHLLVRKLGLDQAIDRHLGLLKIHLPYHESDHVLNIAYNLLAGGTCLEHLELLRNDEAYLDALGARRIPDPTTAGDFCRRFDAADIFRLQEVFNATRLKVWRQQPKSFFEEAILDADGTMVETTGECKQGMDINYKGQWGYHPLVLSLANTGEPLYVVNRSGNRPSHEQAAVYFDRAIALCRQAGFRKIRLRGDTDFTQTEHLDRWDADGRAVRLRHRRHAEPLRTRGRTAAKRLESAAFAGRSTR